MLVRRLVVAMTVASAAVGVLVTSTVATAAGTKCVALVVDDADLGGGVHSSCVQVAQNATGYDVLRAGGHSFTICSNGVLGTIDGKPADGCRVKDGSHYWGYWHRAPGSASWTYSDEGGGTYNPRNASTEGWVWQNGATRQPANVPYSSICKTSPTRTPTPTPSPTRSAAATTSAVAPVTSSPSARRSASPRPLAATSSAPAGATASSPSSTPTPAPARALVRTHKVALHRIPLGLLIGIAAAAALGAAAVIRSRRPSG